MRRKFDWSGASCWRAPPGVDGHLFAALGRRCGTRPYALRACGTRTVLTLFGPTRQREAWPDCPLP